MSKIILLFVFVSNSVFASSLSLQSADLVAGTLNIVITGAPGGAADELLRYFKSAGEKQGKLWGWKETLGGETVISFFFTLQPEELKNLRFEATFATSDKMHSKTKGHVYIPDSASAVLYDWMLKSGLQPNPDDISKTLNGKYVTCWGFKGYPVGQTALNPTCQIRVEK